jgi:hypothetical protein
MQGRRSSNELLISPLGIASGLTAIQESSGSIPLADFRAAIPLNNKQLAMNA